MNAEHMLRRLLFVSPRHQWARIKYLSGLPFARIRRERQFAHIRLESKDGLFLGHTNDGFKRYVPYDDPSLVSWAQMFRAKRLRFEDENLLRPGDLVVNVGACTGEYTVYAGQSVGDAGQVIAYEPDPTHFRCLEANMKLYGLHSVRCENIAAGEKSEQKALHRIGDALAGGSLDTQYYSDYEDRITDTITVPTYSLDDRLGGDDRRVRALVVTVNNYEPEVLRGACDLLKRTEFVIYQSIHHKRIRQFLEQQQFQMEKAVYAGPPGGDEEFIALFKNESVAA